MKKIMMLLMAFCLIVPTMNAQNKALEKARKKEFQTKMKEFKKEKWQLFGTTRTFEVALLSHYDKLNSLGDDGAEIMGVATKVKSKNLGHQMAVNNACLTYAQQAGSHLKGRVVSDMSGNATDTEGEFDKFYAAYERLVEKEIRGELKESFTIIRTNDDGTYEMQSYFIVDEKAASSARIRALEDAARESEMAQKYAKKVSDFVREGFKE
ncbi:hypothetical protein [Prevotella sp. E13-27]|uniref:hypothetical protein n=1 Tax=Prevotella sp. E13-27 TaxID=2938122 RepID=UPI00200B240C|nr:hypothetical protein [Prevotella sp. E13-27]MCK8621999.1 hypothetical protein [Prevotella sp. E13-27]